MPLEDDPFAFVLGEGLGGSVGVGAFEVGGRGAGGYCVGRGGEDEGEGGGGEDGWAGAEDAHLDYLHFASLTFLGAGRFREASIFSIEERHETADLGAVLELLVAELVEHEALFDGELDTERDGAEEDGEEGADESELKGGAENHR